MLTYTDACGIIGSSDFAGQITGAVADVANDIQTEGDVPNHVNRLAWAKRAFASPASVASEVRAAVIMAYADTLPPSGGTLTDSQVKAAVVACVDTFATGT
jgi:hypothetical protein